MPRYIVKPNRDQDYYVEWSEVVDGPIFHGTRAEMAEYGIAQRWSSPEARLTRADETSNSALWYHPSWENDEHYILQQRGWFPRSRMPEVIRAFLDADENPDDPSVLALLEPFEES